MPKGFELRPAVRVGGISLLLLASCGGRTPHPVAATNPYDEQLSCTHLRNERAVNEKRFAELDDERRTDQANNAGLVVGAGIGGLLLMDVSGSEKTEADALKTRNQNLDQLIARKCADDPPPAK